MSEPLISIEGISKKFTGRDGNVTTVFEDLHFSIEPGEFVCLIGHSGCGKTTILNVLSGLEQSSSGYVFVGGREVSGPSLDRAVIFQSPVGRISRASARSITGAGLRACFPKGWRTSRKGRSSSRWTGRRP